MNIRILSRKRRQKRLRKKIRGTAVVPRLTVYRSLSNIYCRIINDEANKVLVTVSTYSPQIRGKKLKKTEASKVVGKLLAEKARDAGIKKIVLDRGGYLYHGRVKAVAEAARKGGLEF